MLVLAYTAAAYGQVPSRPHPVSGVAYTIRVAGQPGTGSGLAAVVADSAKSYTANAVFAAGRGRLDITSGGIASLFAKGDYILFDSTDLVVVRPGTRDFIPVNTSGGLPNFDQLEAMGMKVRVSELKVTIDSTIAPDTVAGYATRHFRMVVAYDMAIEASGMKQSLASVATTDYWVASVPGLPGNPFLRANGFSGGSAPAGVFKDLSMRVDSAAAIMGSRVALRTATSSRLMQGPGSAVELRETSDVSDVHTHAVDESYLTMPAGYKEGAIAGLGRDSSPTSDAGAKWRTVPRGGSR